MNNLPTKAVTQNAQKHQHGAAAVEFAIVLSLLVLIVGGIIEFGRVLWYLDALTKATRDGARYLATSALPLDTDKAGNLVVKAAKQAGLPGSADPLLPEFVVGNVAVSCESATNPGSPCSAPDYVTVAITGYGVIFGSWFSMPLPAVNWPLQPQTTMRYMCTEIEKSC